MIVPQYWAEARRRHRDSKRQITVRRFGWSDVSERDAQIMADTVEGLFTTTAPGSRRFITTFKTEEN